MIHVTHSPSKLLSTQLLFHLTMLPHHYPYQAITIMHFLTHLITHIHFFIHQATFPYASLLPSTSPYTIPMYPIAPFTSPYTNPRLSMHLITYIQPFLIFPMVLH
eukprot:TRINITY_DN24550_c0_g1_i2.p2 TRINITY_DN24550_c0_g1~~TRINITY_DN24550_c0_g1_i2.p2  ORF type:complete len:105 (-),score=3.58 TRINITY_DN24550_c0_g1_i2:81-395(-)